MKADGGNLYIGTFGSGVFRSTDNGANWSGANNGLTYPLVFSLAGDGTNLFAGTYGGGILSCRLMQVIPGLR